jgi:hypothetical protein
MLLQLPYHGDFIWQERIMNSWYGETFRKLIGEKEGKFPLKMTTGSLLRSDNKNNPLWQQLPAIAGSKRTSLLSEHHKMTKCSTIHCMFISQLSTDRLRVCMLLDEDDSEKSLWIKGFI